MAGIYVHIPFCRSKCFYCGFYSVASLRGKEEYLRALCREMELRRGYLPAGAPVETLYFGGGTPSFLDEKEMEVIVRKLGGVWDLSGYTERSLEVNPEDATPAKLEAWRQLGFNRLTIGVQSFDDAVLKRINRTHTGAGAVAAVEWAMACGFENIGIDLIIGLPGSTLQDVRRDVEVAGKLGVAHVSVYILSIDSHSVFEKLSEKGRFKPQADDDLAEQYMLVSELLKNDGYEHYEISNFAKRSMYSKHNTSYWQQKPYIGLGAAAHSYDGNSRQWNVSHIGKYIEGLNHGVLNFEKEVLSDKDRYNECLMTNLRTMWGIGAERLAREYPSWWAETEGKLAGYEARGLARREGGRVRLTERGWLVSDGIFSDLFV